MSNQNNAPDSVELRILSTFKYELTKLDSDIRSASNPDEELRFSTIRSYFQKRVDEIQSRL